MGTQDEPVAHNDGPDYFDPLHQAALPTRR
ncbi:hypothetical protein HNR17_002372 [Galbitalea soli]|nr:hypothetical protein [Galbitalea soli]